MCHFNLVVEELLHLDCKSIPKYRRKVLVNGVDTRLKELVKSICEEIQVDVIEMEIMPDHVHILLEADPSIWYS